MRKPYRRYLFPWFSLAAFIGMLGISFVLAQGHTRAASPQKAAPLTCGTWSVVASPDGSGSYNVLSGVAAVSASNIWAVGSYYARSAGVYQTLIEHWNGTSWSVVASPNVGLQSNSLSGVVAVSANNIWAVGSYYGIPVGRTLIEHWDGTSW